MEKSETTCLFEQLEQYYPNKRIENYAAFFDAWALALEPYDFEDVSRAAARYAAQHRFFPDLSDLTLGLKPNGRYSGGSNA